MPQALLQPALDEDENKPGTHARLRRSIEAACRRLLAIQHPDGHWCAELEGDTILESEYILCLYFLGQGRGERLRKGANYIRAQQAPDGGWATYPGGAADVSVSVKAYLALKLAGDDPDAPHMAAARERILALGGIDACNSFTKIYLSIFGQFDWAQCPAVPPVMILLPRWLYFNIYAMSAWSRTIVVPLSIIWAYKPSSPLPAHARIPELRRPPGAPVCESAQAPPESLQARLWGSFFRLVNALLKGLDRIGFQPFRRRSLAACEAWILERLEKSDGLGAIVPPIINTLIAFRCLGYELDHPVIRGQMEELAKLEIEDGDTLRLQPCLSPVWDTTLALDALQKAGLGGDHPAVLRAARWLLAHEAKEPGDRQLIDPSTPVGGWYFEYANEFYPDCDDTAEAIKGLSQVRFPDPGEDRERRAAIERGLAWLRAMQNRDGGWGAFDRGCDRVILTYVPFADHNAMIDPSTCDITARCLQAMRARGVDPAAPEVARGAAFLRREQEADGSWYGRWGCNYLYGTWLALQGLRAVGDPVDDERRRRAAEWIRSCQNDDGGWGELPRSYDEPDQKGVGPTIPAQTAWALLGLFAAGDFTSEAVRRGIEYLLREQLDGGGWRDDYWNGTGFPRVFYLRYHLYATYFPLQALAAYRRHRSRDRSAGAPALELVSA